ncbi:MAG: histidine kinase [Candidatus Neomarinimicrobiota bacterium]
MTTPKHKNILTQLNFLKLEKLAGSFWILNSLGWVFYWIIVYFNFFWFRDVFKYDIINLFIITVWGFVFTVLLRYIYQKININTQSITTLILITLTSSVIAANVWFWVSRTTYYSLLGRGLTWINQLVPGAYQYVVFWDSVLLIGWSSLYFSIKLFLEWNHQREKTEEAKEQIHKAHLQTLRYQLNPHFLFNSLNSIRALITEDKNDAKKMVTELSEFLRYSLISKNYPEVSLRQEIEAVQHFFYIEKRRYEDKLEISFDIDPLAEDYPIISFIIQPLAENAVKHGMRTSPMPLKVRISAKVSRGVLAIDVMNTGQWIDSTRRKAENDIDIGSGLHNVRQRLSQAYPGSHTFTINKKPDNIHVRMEIHKLVQDTHEKAV